MFFGRNRELQEIAQYLRTGQSVSLAGPTGIGKTSLLIRLTSQAIAAEHGLWDGYLARSIDCTQLAESSITDLFRRFSDTLAAGLASRGLPEEPELRKASASPSRLSFESALRALNHRGLQVILLLDHFEQVSANPLLDLPFYNALRSAAGRFNLAFLTASDQPLIALTYSDHPQEILSSPFFNIFAPLQLSFLPEEEARALIETPALRAGRPFSADQCDFLYRLTGGHPMMLQAACRFAFECPEDPAAIEDHTTREFHSRLENIWLNLAVSEQLALLRVSGASSPDSAPESEPAVLRHLEQLCLIVRKNGKYAFPSMVLCKFIAMKRSKEE
jgi:hypothetical protein